MISSDVIVEPAPAKLNLALHVRRRRADGYHDIETLFAFCRDGDVVTVADAEADSFAMTGPFAGALSGIARQPVLDPEGCCSPRAEEEAERRLRAGATAGVWPRDNLVTRAADAFRGAFGVTQRHAIVLEKNLPIASGIGGGSADAAATLRALARRHGVAHDAPGLLAIAAELGADVPACLGGRTAFGTGKGDALASLDGWSDTPVLLVNPGVAVSTAAVFTGWDGVDRGALDPADPLDGRNDLESPARAIAPVIGGVVALLAAQPGVTLARMSGSGATCFALFATPADRDAADAAVAHAAPDWWRLATTLA
ncbi:4-(cytidine 5'-diphospho)-2-C-methyl-D-erythritol kinase [Sphingomonas jeddahensis]|uniref:4-diphosphocytidyl-2-C-methyl-D-erythritol kinase n=1 Tax=Sphingomonas jeddahensis TaxID=1915074 RepID=A0A1V2EXS7_9SPHN|nr:4-(cytidine 5'-diphospho)-2-C-methyl-D-erythritol kinase [Sphingomonas jeddahensis]ONF97285.1 4-diphosphocytidyl-2-C-methyl-D-erythritol kinase [Sphingomonas jeddahensis]